ncbi:hypothetical protein FA95DRAFT_92798 [Auriscalpium vulgare]|uniref:Uncharacterized protein n=1 Tax=Auriscalpium vulgare TaxID=40419 RepID=A0ACB8RPE6_9AGAM|nr:hypothetical protein FA95DRAFT_92798 [Auriscalpium vulgare]
MLSKGRPRSLLPVTGMSIGLFSSSEPDEAVTQTGPIFSLPLELFVRIIKFASQYDPTLEPPRRDTASREADAVRRLGWICVTHVCSSWRRIVLETPTLWWEISPRLGPTWMETILARSKGAPVDLMLQREEVKSAVRIASLHLSHARSIFFGPGVPDEQDAWLMELPAPILKTYECYGISSHQPNLFANHAPLLRRLVIHNVWDYPWTQQPFRTLVHLTVDGSKDPPSAEEFFNVLQGTPALEHLALARCLPENFKFLAYNLLVELPHLKTLRLDGDVSSVAECMARFHINPSTHLDLRCFSEDARRREYARIFPVILAHLSRAGSSAPPLRHLMLEVEIRCFVRFLVTRDLPAEVRGIDFFFLDRTPDIRVEFCWLYGTQDAEAALALPDMIFNALPLANVEMFSFLAFQRLWPKAFWVNIMRKFPRIKYLGSSERALFRALFYSNEELNEWEGLDAQFGHDDGLLFPCLETFIIEHDILWSLFDSGEISSAGLVELLERRRLASPLRTVFVSDLFKCNMEDESWSEQLAKTLEEYFNNKPPLP